MDREEEKQQHQQPLTSRSTNTHLSTTSTSGAADEKAMPQKQNGFLRPSEIQQNQSHYVSPSDGIMSPCTKKLSDLKGKRFRTAGKPQSLFAKTIQKRSLENGIGAEKDSSPSAEKIEGEK
ncbi:hypothetical protein FQN54_007516 [Arachnomyces sp. PD_36]|nr:hypothetical protein FQN54_007516 [Arachnomyces sp. PD_36]